MRLPRGLTATTVGTNDRGDLVVDVRFKRRSVYAVRLFYRTARRCGIGRARSAWFAARLALSRGGE